MARKIAILVFIFAAFYMGAHFYLRWRNTVTDDVTRISRLVECEPNEVRAIKIAMSGGETRRFSRKDSPRAGLNSSAQLSFSEWNFEEPLKGEADASSMVRFATMLCEIYDPMPISAAQFKAAQTGAQSILFTLAGGKSAGDHEVSFGEESSDHLAQIRYRAAGAEKFFKIPSKISQLASLEPKEFLNVKIMRMAADNVISASIYSENKVKFSMEREGEGWKILRGGKSLGKGSEEADKFINRLTTLRALKVNEEGLSPTACERASSKISVELQGVGDRKEALYFQYGKTGTLSVCNSAREALFTVHRDLVPFLEVDTQKLISKNSQ